MAKKNFVNAKGARLLRKVAKHILAEPRRYDQDVWRLKGRPGERCWASDGEYPACGTVACIGGWINTLTHARGDAVYNTDRACSQIGVSHEGMDRLFGTFDDWPKRYARAYENAKTQAGKARVAARRIEHFIKTGE